MNKIEKLEAEVAYLRLIVKKNQTPRVFTVSIVEYQAVEVGGEFSILGERQLLTQKFMANDWEKAVNEAKTRFREEIGVKKKHLSVETKETDRGVLCVVSHKGGLPLGSFEVSECIECDTCRFITKALTQSSSAKVLEDNDVDCISELLQIVFEGEDRAGDDDAFEFYFENEITPEALEGLLINLISDSPRKEFASYSMEVRQTVHDRLQSLKSGKSL